MPRNAMDTGYGWKRVCGDFEGHNAKVRGASQLAGEASRSTDGLGVD